MIVVSCPYTMSRITLLLQNCVFASQMESFPPPCLQQSHAYMQQRHRPGYVVNTSSRKILGDHSITVPPRASSGVHRDTRMETVADAVDPRSRGAQLVLSACFEISLRPAPLLIRYEHVDLRALRDHRTFCRDGPPIYAYSSEPNKDFLEDKCATCPLAEKVPRLLYTQTHGSHW